MATKRVVDRIDGVALLLALCTGWMSAQSASVTVRVHLDRGKQKSAGESSQMAMKDRDMVPVVVWLTPVGADALLPAVLPHEPYRLIQKNKQFTPHVLVVPAGSSVEFPNLDPFFHNVFSLFNGKRFDLGLYEAGSRRSVRFDREGVSYIFCNIHPEMGAVVISLRTRWFAMTGAGDEATISQVPRGIYRLHLWAEDVTAEQLAAAERQVLVEDAPVQAGDIHLTASAHTMQGHQNKFGDAYSAPAQSPY